MKRWRFLSALCAFVISCAIMPVTMVDAADSVNISSEPVYEFLIVGEVYIYEGQNYHLGDYKTLDMTVKLFIEPDGSAEFLFVADQDFTYESEKSYTVKVNNEASKGEHFLGIDAPYWCEIPNSVDCYTAVSSDRWPNVADSCRDSYSTDKVYIISTCQFYEHGYKKPFSEMPLSFEFLDSSHQSNSVYNPDGGGVTNINVGDAIGRVRVEFSHPIVYVSDDQQQFIVEKNEKKYVDDDMFVTFTIDGTSITKEIGLHYDDSPAMIYKQGDANNDGSLNITDVVLLQKWLLADPDAHFETWCSADMNHDSRLDVFDLCLMKRALLNK